jgi:hypothetical protein
VALGAHSERPDLNVPEDYKHDHPQEHPSDWGWHGEWGRTARAGGWIVLLILLVMLTATHYNHSGSFWLILSAAALFVVLVWDRYRRKFSWRK